MNQQAVCPGNPCSFRSVLAHGKRRSKPGYKNEKKSTDLLTAPPENMIHPRAQLWIRHAATGAEIRIGLTNRREKRNEGGFSLIQKSGTDHIMRTVPLILFFGVPWGI
jgi:hypothetical protein